MGITKLINPNSNLQKLQTIQRGDYVHIRLPYTHRQTVHYLLPSDQRAAFLVNRKAKSKTGNKTHYAKVPKSFYQNVVIEKITVPYSEVIQKRMQKMFIQQNLDKFTNIDISRMEAMNGNFDTPNIKKNVHFLFFLFGTQIIGFGFLEFNKLGTYLISIEKKERLQELIGDIFI